MRRSPESFSEAPVAIKIDPEVSTAVPVVRDTPPLTGLSADPTTISPLADPRPLVIATTPPAPSSTLEPRSSSKPAPDLAEPTEIDTEPALPRDVAEPDETVTDPDRLPKLLPALMLMSPAATSVPASAPRMST